MTTPKIKSANTFSIELGKHQVETVQNVGGLTFGQGAIETSQASPSGELLIGTQPGVPQAGEITVTRGKDKSDVFTKWIGKTISEPSLETARQDISIVMHDSNRKPVKRFILNRAWVSRYQGPGLDASSSAPTETVTITFEEVNVQNVQ